MLGFKRSSNRRTEIESKLWTRGLECIRRIVQGKIWNTQANACRLPSIIVKGGRWKLVFVLIAMRGARDNHRRVLRKRRGSRKTLKSSMKKPEKIVSRRLFAKRRDTWRYTLRYDPETYTGGDVGAKETTKSDDGWGWAPECTKMLRSSLPKTSPSLMLILESNLFCPSNPVSSGYQECSQEQWHTCENVSSDVTIV